MKVTSQSNDHSHGTPLKICSSLTNTKYVSKLWHDTAVMAQRTSAITEGDLMSLKTVYLVKSIYSADCEVLHKTYTGNIYTWRYAYQVSLQSFKTCKTHLLQQLLDNSQPTDWSYRYRLLNLYCDICISFEWRYCETLRVHYQYEKEQVYISQ